MSEDQGRIALSEYEVKELQKLKFEFEQADGGAASTDEHERKFEEFWSVVEGNPDWGSRVDLTFRDGYEVTGYLIGLPLGFHANEVEGYGVVFCPWTEGEKCDAGPLWLSLWGLAQDGDVTSCVFSPPPPYVAPR